MKRDPEMGIDLFPLEDVLPGGAVEGRRVKWEAELSQARQDESELPLGALRAAATAKAFSLEDYISLLTRVHRTFRRHGGDTKALHRAAEEHQSTEADDSAHQRNHQSALREIVTAHADDLMERLPRSEDKPGKDDAAPTQLD